MYLNHINRLVAFVLLVLFPAPAAFCADEPSEANWVDISSAIVQKLADDGQKTAWPGETAGVAVDPASGDVYMIVTGLGIWKSTDAGQTFARVDEGKIGGRCETSFALHADSSGKRLACFMLDGKCAWTGDAGKSWNAFADVGRNSLIRPCAAIASILANSAASVATISLPHFLCGTPCEAQNWYSMRRPATQWRLRSEPVG
jgi:hypothetical protein